MTSSTDIKDLATALAKAQSKIIGAVKDSTNPFFKSTYSDLASVWEAIREPLTSNGLSVVQAPVETDKGSMLETIIMHNSGQWISGTIKVQPIKDDPQGRGSALSYARRYALASMLSVPSIDDDGNAAMGHKKEDGNMVKHKESTPPYPIPQVDENEELPIFDELPENKPKEDVNSNLPLDEEVEIGKYKGRKFSEVLLDQGYLFWVNDCLEKDYNKTHNSLKRLAKYARFHGAYRK